MERNSFVFIILIFFLHCLNHPFILIAATNTITTTTDQDALLALKAHVTDDPTNFLAKNWNTTISICNWIGVICDNIQQRVTVLNLSYLNLTGTIPFQLGNLSLLQTLDLSHNHFFGTIPSSIFTTYTLKLLILNVNQLSGSFPPFDNISSLQVLDVNNNSLSGKFPNSICNYLLFLKFFYLSGNLFDGEIPSTLSKCKQLRHLSLSYSQFSGAIPKEIGNLTKLKELDLSYNTLQGEIPQELGYLAKLESLSLKKNLLIGTIPSSIFNLSSISARMDFANNNLMGSFPEDMCHYIPFLEGFYIAYNQFSGPIPQLWRCRKLVHISLMNNQFSGRIPRGIGNLTSAKTLNLVCNNLIGEIPHEIGNLHNLEVLLLANNNLVGVVPATIFNMSTMIWLSLANNTLSGSLPSSKDLALPNVEKLDLTVNNFNGPIPSFIFNSSKLSYLDMGMNSFSGFIPRTFDNLRNLKRLGLGDNYLTSSTPQLSFLSSLINCKRLKEINLAGNPLHAILPSSIGNLPDSLERIYMPNCDISGSIPKEIGNLINLITLSLGGNKLNGTIPVSLGRLQKLQGLALQNNKLEGPIPNYLCYLPQLFRLDLEENKFSGSIPACLGNLSTLRVLTLSSNKLTSTIPSTLWNLRDILLFNLSSNSLMGSLPLDIENLKVVVHMDLSKNFFSGDIPITIIGLKDLQILFLGYNRLTGSIPESIDDMTSLALLDLSNNKLSGVIPKSMEKLLYLKYLNLSFNILEGEIPRRGSFANFSAKSFVGNDLLCGSPNLQVPPCKSNKTGTHRKSKKNVRLIGIVLPLGIVFILAVGAVLISKYQKRSTKMPNDAMSQQATWRQFSYLELLRATNRFSESNLIDRGSFGSVYKARFEDGIEVAIKVFHLQSDEALKSFDVECEVMKSVRHRNLVKIISSCSNDDFKALVLEYMSNGSLEKCLYSNNCILDIFQRLNIMIDVALALEYLHFGLSTPIVHCDLKPSNVLLDENLVTHLSDFGISKLLGRQDQTMTQTQTFATIGYMAPEYGREGKISTKSDVYSYGIMLMETFTKKKPTDAFFVGEMSLKSWVNDLLHSSMMELVDTNLLSMEDRYFLAKEQCIASILNLAIECTIESPKERINTRRIVKRLMKIRDTLLKNVEGRKR